MYRCRAINRINRNLIEIARRKDKVERVHADFRVMIHASSCRRVRDTNVEWDVSRKRSTVRFHNLPYVTSKSRVPWNINESRREYTASATLGEDIYGTFSSQKTDLVFHEIFSLKLHVGA